MKLHVKAIRYKKPKIRSYGFRSRRAAKLKTVSYCGSPDSDVVAQYINRFEYRPERKDEILREYEKLINRPY